MAALVASAAAGCGVGRGPADRTDHFTAAGVRCTGSWWLEETRHDTGHEALTVAERALAGAQVTPEALDSAVRLVELSMTDDQSSSSSPSGLESEAYMLAVTLHVKDALDAAGYPDIRRAVEIRSQHTCS